MNLRFPLAVLLAAVGWSGIARVEGGEKKAADVVVESELISADLKDKNSQGFCKTFTFKMEMDKAYQIVLTSKDFPALLRLENDTGNQVETVVARFGSAHVSYRPTKTQDFQIVCASQNAGAVGKFTLVVKEIAGADGKPIELKNDKGQASHQGNLLNTDPAHKGGKKHKMYLFNMEAGKTYQIDMTSKAFDSYLFLESPDGKHLTQDDDGGGYPSARIVYKAAETGKHRIISTYFGAGTGPFELNIRQTDGGAPRDDKKDAAK